MISNFDGLNYANFEQTYLLRKGIQIVTNNDGCFTSVKSQKE